MNTLMVFYKFYLDYTHFLISNDVILVFYMSSTEFALPMFVYFDYHLFRWCSIESFSWMAQFCHSVRKCHSTTNVQTYCHFLWWHYTILTFDIKMWITSYTNKVKDKGNTSKKKKKKKKKKKLKTSWGQVPSLLVLLQLCLSKTCLLLCHLYWLLLSRW